MLIFLLLSLSVTVFTVNCKLSPTVYEHFSSRQHFHRRPVIQEINSKHHAVSATVNQVNQVNQVRHWPPHVLPLNTTRFTDRLDTFNRTNCHVQPHVPPRSTTRSATFSRTPRHVLLYTTSYESTSRLLTTRHCRSPHPRSPISLSSAHRFCSPPLTESAHFCSRTLNQQPTNAHASTNEHSRPLNEHSSHKFHTALVHVVSTTFCHSL